jgi:long-chain acyl-CoA synthetase
VAEHKNVLEWAYHWEKNAPERVAMTQPLGGGNDNVKDYTWAEMMDQARRMASHLKSLGLPEKSQVAICSKNCAHWIMADLAIWMAGHVSVPVFPILTQDIVTHVLEHSEAKLLFVGKLDPVWEQMKPGVPDALPKIAFPLAPENDHDKWDDIVAKNEPLQDVADRDPNEMATIIYTSGSTGLPKGVMVSFYAMLQTTKGINKILKVVPEDRYLSYLPIAHGMERWLGECLVLFSGCRVFYAESLTTFVQDLQRARPTVFLSVPRLWLKFQAGVYQKVPPKKLARLLKIPILSSLVKKKIVKGLGLDKARFAGSGSAPLPGGILAWYRKLGLELLEGYGMTENFNYSHITKPGDTKVGFIGTTYHDVECRLSEEGEIQVKGPGTMMGYFKQPEETKEVLIDDGWLRTGDRGILDDANRLQITGRTKEIFKTSKGKYVAPAPIENVLVNHPSIELCCVGGAGYPQPYAVVQLAEGVRENTTQETVISELEEHLRAVNAALPGYEKLQFLSVVKDVWAAENGFLTPTMKIKRPKIEETYAPFNDEWYEAKKPVVWQN